MGLLLAGCQTPARVAPAETAEVINERHTRLYGDAELPRKIGTVENIGLQTPLVSPDGRQLLYLQTDQEQLSPLTLLGSPDPADTPTGGALSIWLRPVEGTATGRRVSSQRWAHSGVWSDSGRALAYVANEPPTSLVVHVDLETGQETELGLRGALNGLPRFDADDETLLFCAAGKTDAPFRIFCQRVGDPEPSVLTPPGPDCFFPVVSDGRAGLLCVQAAGEQLNWVQCGPSGSAVLATPWGLSARPAWLQTWAGIATPLAPDRRSVLFYDAASDRVCVLHVAGRIVRRHRQGSIAACWLDPQTIAVATADGVFAVNTTTGMSVSLFNGQWIPCRYVAAERRLILLGRETPRRFAIWELVFKSRPPAAPRPSSEPRP